MMGRNGASYEHPYYQWLRARHLIEWDTDWCWDDDKLRYIWHQLERAAEESHEADG